MIIYLYLRLMRLGQLMLPRKAFLATYQPSNEPERAQAQAERNKVRRATYEASKRLS